MKKLENLFLIISIFVILIRIIRELNKLEIPDPYLSVTAKSMDDCIRINCTQNGCCSNQMGNNLQEPCTPNSRP
jgi:translation elongation factor EF-4